MEKTWWRSSSTSCYLIGIFVTDMRLMIIKTSGIHCHKSTIHGWQIGGSVGYLISFWPSQRLMYFWFYTNLFTVGYVRRGCLRYWSFFGSWRGKLLTIYTLGKGRGGGYFFPDSIHWLRTEPRQAIRYQNRRWICTAKNANQQYNCSFKGRKNIRTYCVCTPGVCLCSDCNI